MRYLIYCDSLQVARRSKCSQKNRGGLAWFARRASQWLLLRVKERKVVKGQANEETCKPSGNWKMKGADEVGRVFTDIVYQRVAHTT